MDDRRREQIRKAIGGAIARARIGVGKTQEQVAEALDVGPEAISRIERGVVDPPIARVFELAEVLGIGVGDLIVPPSNLEADQARVMARIVSDLAVADRDHVIALAGLAAEHLRQKSALGRAKR